MIRTLLNNELKRLFVTPLAWLSLGIGQIIVAWAFFSELEIYETLQPRLTATESPLGVTSLVIIPALLNTLNIIMLMTPLLTMRSIASERQSNRFDLILATPASARQIVSAKFLAVFLLLSIFWLLSLLQALTLTLATQPDLGKILLTALIGLLVIATFTAAGIWLSSLTRHPVIAAIATLGLLMFLRIIGNTDTSGFLNWFSITLHTQAARQGLFNSSDIIFYILFSAFFLSLAWSKILSLRTTQNRWSSRATIILLLIILTLSWPVLDKHQYNIDLSDNQQNTLSPATQELLQQLDKPLSFTVYVSESPVLKKQITQLLTRFKRSNQDSVIQFVDPQKQPEAARTLGITRNGEILVRYNDRQQLVKKLDESSIAKTIMHLSQRDQGWILNLQGHGEMDLLDNGLYGASTLTKNLRARGYQLRNYNLGELGQLPVNTKLIMINGARHRLTDIELAIIDAYLSKGGNLLLLTDPNSTFKLSSFASLPRVSRLPGVIVDATAAKLKLSSPDNALVTSYPDHEISQQITQHTLFPQAAALDLKSSEQWQTAATFLTGSLSWNETGELKGEIARDPLLFEQQGPLTIGALLKRQLKNATQKVALFGDSDFPRNHMLGQGDNLQLVLNLFYWLTHDDTATASIIKPKDQVVTISETGRALFGGFFLFLLPALLILSGFFIPWLRKRRA